MGRRQSHENRAIFSSLFSEMSSTHERVFLKKEGKKKEEEEKDKSTPSVKPSAHLSVQSSTYEAVRQGELCGAT